MKQFTGGIAQLFKANKVTAYYGFGQLQPGNVVKVKQHDGSDIELKGTNIIIAAGSDSIELRSRSSMATPSSTTSAPWTSPKFPSAWR